MNSALTAFVSTKSFCVQVLQVVGGVLGAVAALVFIPVSWQRYGCCRLSSRSPTADTQQTLS